MQRRGRIHVEQVDDDIWVGGHTVLGVTGAIIVAMFRFSGWIAAR